MSVFIDTEATGLSAEKDDVLEIAIINSAGQILLNSLVRPEKNTTWPEAEAINGITPAMVANAPTLQELAPQIRAALMGKDVVAYNMAFDIEFLRPVLSGWKSGENFFLHCAMRRFSVAVGVWDDRTAGSNDYKRWKLQHAAERAGHQWTGDAHRALADAQACRSVWLWVEGLK